MNLGSAMPFERFAVLSWRAELIALLLCSVGVAIAACAIFQFGKSLLRRSFSAPFVWFVCSILLFASYFAYTAAYVSTWWVLEWQFTHVNQFCHFPGAIARVAPLPAIAVAFWYVSRKNHESSVA